MRTECLRTSVVRVASGPRVKLVDCNCVLNFAVVYSTDRSKAVARCYSYPLLLYGLFYEAICFKSCLVFFFFFFFFFFFVLLFFSPLNIAITSLGEERANMSDFFVRLFGFV